MGSKDEINVQINANFEDLNKYLYLERVKELDDVVNTKETKLGMKRFVVVKYLFQCQFEVRILKEIYVPSCL